MSLSEKQAHKKLFNLQTRAIRLKARVARQESKGHVEKAEALSKKLTHVQGVMAKVRRLVKYLAIVVVVVVVLRCCFYFTILITLLTRQVSTCSH